jgi:hypothetical protein
MLCNLEKEITQMTVFCSSLNLWRRSARLAAFVIVLAAAWVAGARAQTPPYALFQYSTITGSGNTITATQLPVVTTSGTVYQNVTLLFDVDASGNLTLAPGYPEVVKSPRPFTANFVPGTYVGPSTILSGKAIITVSGPSVGPGGITEWSLSAPTGADPCSYPSSAVWYAVPALANSPLAARLSKAGITSTAVQYGVGGSQCSTDGYDWEQNTLLGFSQTSGTTLAISSYTYDGVTDYNTARDTITYTLQTP